MPRLTMLSMPCDEPVPALAALLAAPGVEIARVVLATMPEDASEAGGEACASADDESAIVRLARSVGVPVVRARSMWEVRAAIGEDVPDLAVAACFPWRLRREARELPRRGVVNIHPSLLPSGRGPEPVFWTFRNGERETGVTVHWMDEGFDTGPILAQRRFLIPDDLDAPSLESRLLGMGGELVAELLGEVAAGEAPGVPQARSAGTRAPTPTAADWLMPASLPAGWAWRFARAVAPMGGPLAAAAGGKIIPVGAPVAMEDWARPGEAVVEHDDGTVTIRFSPGSVRFARRASDE